MLRSFFNHSIAESQKDQKWIDQARAQYGAAQARLNPVMTDFWQLEEIARLAFSSDIYGKMEGSKETINKLLIEIATRGRKEDSLFKELAAKQAGLAESIRTELEM